MRIGIENCPMLFTADEWPGGKNLAISPAIWRRMFAEIPSPSFGLNFDPSHLIWQQMDYLAAASASSRDRLVHVHAKDARIDRERLDEDGVLATPSSGTRPSSPAWATSDWGALLRRPDRRRLRRPRLHRGRGPRLRRLAGGPQARRPERALPSAVHLRPRLSDPTPPQREAGILQEAPLNSPTVTVPRGR